jgi:hypothetical protein
LRTPCSCAPHAAVTHRADDSHHTAGPNKRRRRIVFWPSGSSHFTRGLFFPPPPPTLPSHRSSSCRTDGSVRVEACLWHSTAQKAETGWGQATAGKRKGVTRGLDSAHWTRDDQTTKCSGLGTRHNISTWESGLGVGEGSCSSCSMSLRVSPHSFFPPPSPPSPPLMSVGGPHCVGVARHMPERQHDHATTRTRNVSASVWRQRQRGPPLKKKII